MKTIKYFISLVLLFILSVNFSFANERYENFTLIINGETVSKNGQFLNNNSSSFMPYCNLEKKRSVFSDDLANKKLNIIDIKILKKDEKGNYNPYKHYIYNNFTKEDLLCLEKIDDLKNLLNFIDIDSQNLLNNLVDNNLKTKELYNANIDILKNIITFANNNLKNLEKIFQIENILKEHNSDEYKIILDKNTLNILEKFGYLKI